MLRHLLFLPLLFLSLSLVAQERYTVRVGTFRDVKADDFGNLKSKGFVYGIPTADNTTDVYLGHFTTQAKVNAAAAEVRNTGFRNATPYALPVAAGQPVTVIQIALHSGNRPIDWSTLEQAGDLYVEAVDGTTKILTGVYPDTRTAASFLPAIRSLGYSDAFVRTINNALLIPISTFETGIKKPLIPITIGAKAPTPAPQPNGQPQPESQVALGGSPATYGNPNPIPDPAPARPGGTSREESGPAPTPTAASRTTTLPVPAAPADVALPAIDGKTKRSSSANLQRVLKEKGYYSGSIDGYYGPGTAAAYERAWSEMPEIRKYRRLAEKPLDPAGTVDRVSKWPEVNVLLAVSEDLSAGLGNATRARQLVQQRDLLFDATQPLNDVATTRVNNWATTLWGNLDDWSTEDPLHAQITSALRVAYHQSHVRLEDHYMDRGLTPRQARDLATAMLQNLIGAPLDRFL